LNILIFLPKFLFNILPKTLYMVNTIPKNR